MLVGEGVCVCVCVCMCVQYSPRLYGRGRHWASGRGRGATGAAESDRTKSSRK